MRKRTRFLYGLTLAIGIMFAVVIAALPPPTIASDKALCFGIADTPTSVEGILYSADIREGAPGSDRSTSATSTFGTMDTAQDVCGFSTIGTQTDHLATYEVNHGVNTQKGMATTVAHSVLTDIGVDCVT